MNFCMPNEQPNKQLIVIIHLSLDGPLGGDKARQRWQDRDMKSLVPVILYFATLQMFQALLYNVNICDLYLDSGCVERKADTVQANLKFSKRYCELSVYCVFLSAVATAVQITISQDFTVVIKILTMHCLKVHYNCQLLEMFCKLSLVLSKQVLFMFPDWIMFPKQESLSYYGKAHMYKEKEWQKQTWSRKKTNTCF